MVRKSYWVVVAVVAMTVAWTGVAAAAPPATASSSWVADVADGEIVGGQRSIVVSNPTNETIADHVINITSVPCNCVVVDKTGAGVIRGDYWLVPDIEPGASAEVDLVYGPAETTSVVAASASVEIWLLVVITGLVTAGVVARRMPGTPAFGSA